MVLHFECLLLSVIYYLWFSLMPNAILLNLAQTKVFFCILIMDTSRFQKIVHTILAVHQHTTSVQYTTATISWCTQLCVLWNSSFVA